MQTQLFGQGTAFSYEGQLNSGNGAATGLYDFEFALSNAPSGGSQVGVTVTNLALGVTNGSRTTALDLGAVFTGPQRWLEIAARTNGSGSFNTLTPRQQLTPTPYAIFANTASNVLGAVPSAQITGTISPVQLPPNVITNLQSGVTLGGGQGNLIQRNAAWSSVGGGFADTIQSGASGSTIAGGNNNIIGSGASVATIAGGHENLAVNQYTFAAGQQAQALHQGAFVWSDTEPGPFASTTTDSFNVRAQGGGLINAGTNNLEIASGGLKITGAGINTGTAAFTHLTSASTIRGNQTTINNPFCNNDPNAIHVVTHNYNPGGTTVGALCNHAGGVSYSGGKWKIYNEDTTTTPTNMAFNVLVIKH